MKNLTVRKILAAVETALNAEIPGTPRIGGRVLYVALPGNKKNREALSRRGSQLYAFLVKHKNATSAALQAGLKVNRNVIAGAMHELRKAGLVQAHPAANVASASAAEYRPRRQTSIAHVAATSADRSPRRRK